MARSGSPWSWDDGGDCFARSGPASLDGLSRPNSPLISNSPLLFKFRPPSNVSPPRFRAFALLKDRDKESLLEEIVRLNAAIDQQAAYLRKQKVYASKLRSHNRLLERNVDELELLGIKGPRTGAPSRLRAILEGLKCKLGSLQVTCVCQEEEIFQLQRDLRVTISKVGFQWYWKFQQTVLVFQETQVQRDILAGELARLHILVKHLKKSKARLLRENKEIERLREKNMLLEIANNRLAASIEAVQGSVLKAQEDMDLNRRMAEDAVADVLAVNQKCEDYIALKSQLEKLIEKEKSRRKKLQKRATNLSLMIARTEKNLLELRKGSKMPALNLKGGGNTLFPICHDAAQLAVPKLDLVELRHRIVVSRERGKKTRRTLKCRPAFLPSGHERKFAPKISTRAKTKRWKRLRALQGCDRVEWLSKRHKCECCAQWPSEDNVQTLQLDRSVFHKPRVLS